MGGLFLTISPNIRQTVLDGVGSVTREMEVYAPYSYIAGVVLVLLLVAMSFYRGAQPQ
ncbi:MAG TPA: hypothetical protein VMH28_26575 [Candidatus Acidoferrales bacterium]|nr:hypothetical protein [Candidatus Acidoferrales bacterium]